MLQRGVEISALFAGRISRASESNFAAISTCFPNLVPA